MDALDDRRPDDAQGRAEADAVIVIRSARERTASVCRALLAEQVPGSTIHMLEERPFEAALRTCYQIGIESGADWLVTVDADIMAAPTAIEALLQAARRMPEHVAQVEGMARDKLNGVYRGVGHRAYRTAYLGRALAHIPAEGAELRPEFSTLQRLAAEGLPSMLAEDVVFGVHDYQQFYRDIYRKTFVQGQKFRDWIAQVIPRWRVLSVEDPDFQVALRGYFDGYLSPTAATIDSRTYLEASAACLDTLGLSEKEPLDPRDIASVKTLVARVLSEPRPKPPLPRARVPGEALRRLGLVRAIPYVLGVGFRSVGLRLRRIADADERMGPQPPADAIRPPTVEPETKDGTPGP